MRISAHGLGGAKDLPIPSELAIAGAVAALVISFTVLAIAWREPRYDAATSGRPAPAWLDRLVSSRALAVAARVLGMAFFLYVAAAAVFGFLWLFAMPFQVPLVIAADPTRRAALLIGGAQLAGSSLGPLAAGAIVSESNLAPVLWFGAASLVLAVALLVGASRRA